MSAKTRDEIRAAFDAWCKRRGIPNPKKTWNRGKFSVNARSAKAYAEGRKA